MPLAIFMAGWAAFQQLLFHDYAFRAQLHDSTVQLEQAPSKLCNTGAVLEDGGASVENLPFFFEGSAHA